MTILTFLSSKSPGGQVGTGKRSLRSRIIELSVEYCIVSSLQRTDQPITDVSLHRRVSDGLLMLDQKPPNFSPCGFAAPLFGGRTEPERASA
jgi:hypothetical protein